MRRGDFSWHGAGSLIYCSSFSLTPFSPTIIYFICRTTGKLSTEGIEAEENYDVDLLEQANPFLAKLVSTFIPSDRLATSTAKSLIENISDVEAGLRKRMAATMDAARRVLEAVEENRGASTPGDGGGATHSINAGAASGSAAKESQLAALTSLLKAENNRLRDQALQDASKIKQLESNLAGECWGKFEFLL